MISYNSRVFTLKYLLTRKANCTLNQWLQWLSYANYGFNNCLSLGSLWDSYSKKERALCTYFACGSALHNINKPAQLTLRKASPILQYCLMYSTLKSPATPPFWPLVKKRPKLCSVLSTLAENTPSWSILGSSHGVYQFLLDRQQYSDISIQTHVPDPLQEVLSRRMVWSKAGFKSPLSHSPPYHESVHTSHWDHPVSISSLCCSLCFWQQKISRGASLSVPLGPYTRELACAELSH